MQKELGQSSTDRFLRGDGRWENVEWVDVANRPDWLTGRGYVYSNSYIGIGGKPTCPLYVHSSVSAPVIIEYTPTSPDTLRVQFYTYNVGGFYSGSMLSLCAARGSKSSPAAVRAGDRLASFNGLGYNGSGYSVGASLDIVAFENWSSTANGAYLGIRINGPGEASAPTKFKFEGAGALAFFGGASTPSSPAPGEAKVYVKGGKLIVQYNDGGTIRYKYLNLSGTGTTWVHTTTAP